MRSASRPGYTTAPQPRTTSRSPGRVLVAGLVTLGLFGAYFGTLAWLFAIVLAGAGAVGSTLPWWAFVRLGVVVTFGLFVAAAAWVWLRDLD